MLASFEFFLLFANSEAVFYHSRPFPTSQRPFFRALSCARLASGGLLFFELASFICFFSQRGQLIVKEGKLIKKRPKEAKRGQKRPKRGQKRPTETKEAKRAQKDPNTAR